MPDWVQLAVALLFGFGMGLLVTTLLSKRGGAAKFSATLPALNTAVQMELTIPPDGDGQANLQPLTGTTKTGEMPAVVTVTLVRVDA